MTGREAILFGRPAAPQDTPRKSILHCLQMLSPFREAMPESGLPPSDLAEGERQFYAFIKGLYEEMYGDPAFFLIPETEYDEYLHGKEAGELKAREKAHETDQKECNLRNRFQQAIRFYAAYFYELGIRARELDNGVLILSEEAWKAARAAMEWPHLRGENRKRYDRLRGLGLDERVEAGNAFLTSREFPKMFYGLWALCTARDNKYRRMDYLRLDYAGALRGGPAAEDVFLTLSPERACAARRFHEALTERGMKEKIKPLREITRGSRWKVDYLTAGKSAAGIYAGPDSLCFCIHFNGAENITAMSVRLKAEKPELGQWFDSKFPERLCKCPSNRRVELSGGTRRICGLSCRAEIPDPGRQDIENSLQVLAIFRDKPGRS